MKLMQKSKDGGNEEDKLQYGRFTFQGAYVYSIDPAKGFILKGRITHLTEDDYLKAGDHWYNSDFNVERILYIGIRYIRYPRHDKATPWTA